MLDCRQPAGVAVAHSLPVVLPVVLLLPEEDVIVVGVCATTFVSNCVTWKDCDMAAELRPEDSNVVFSVSFKVLSKVDLLATRTLAALVTLATFEGEVCTENETSHVPANRRSLKESKRLD